MEKIKNKFQLDDLSNPQKYHEPLNIQNYSKDQLINFLISMCRIRLAEKRLAEARRDGLIGGPVHLGVGQEAVASGVSLHLRKSDRVFGAHRSHSHILALGSSIHKLFAEILGKNTGLSKGMGGSMHLWDQPHGFYGSVPIVSGTVPLAVGAGLAAKLQKTDDVAIVYLGDGAVEEGVVHESLNLSRIQNIPVIFVVENNFFASHMHISIRQPKNSTSRFAEANDIPFHVVDGNNVLDVTIAASELISKARSGKGPGFIEAVTYRWYGHVDWREDIDVGVNRSQHELENWKRRDPIRRLKEAMILENMWNEKKQNELELQLKTEIDAAWEQALNDPYPHEKELLECVYSNGNTK